MEMPSQEILEALLGVGLPAIVGILMLLALVVGGVEVAARIRGAGSQVKKYVDDPNDGLIQLFEMALETAAHKDVDPAVISRVLVHIIQATQSKVPEQIMAQLQEAGVDLGAE